jgi:hypothetical protein
MLYTVRRTIVAGFMGGLAFVLGTFLTFAQFSGSRRGQEGLLFNPATQHPKVIAAWKDIEPLPRVIENPPIILAGMMLLGLAYAFVYRAVAAAWPVGVGRRTLRLAPIIWLSTVFSEFMGPFNVLHQPLYLSVVAWSFWAVSAAAAAFAIAYVHDRRSEWPDSKRPAAASQ